VPRILIASTDPPVALPFLDTTGVERIPRASPLEEEVTALYNQLRNPLLRYLLSFGLSAQDGEEVIQEVFLSLFQHLRRGKSRQNLRGWVFRVGHNLALKQRMRNNRSVSVRYDEVASERHAPGPNPEESVANAQRQRRLLAVVGALPEQDRNCLFLRAEGLRYREIAEVLGMSLGGVSLSLGRALARLSNVDVR
jgi:RNA polymerase sigma-70 factor, ECF subfamily